MLETFKKMDPAINCAFGALLLVGLIIVMSSSLTIGDKLYGDPMHYFYKQTAILAFSLVVMLMVYQIPLAKLGTLGFPILFLCLFLLIIVLIPGIGKAVNGSRRWLNLGVATIQVAEFVKLLFVIYLAGYLVRHRAEVTEKFIGFLKPFILIFILGGFLLLQPDFGSVVVLVSTSLAMLWVARAKIWHFAIGLLAIILMLTVVAVSSPYRFKRLTTFINPWEDPFGDGYQLTQSFIAIGNGSWFGNGLGTSIQKYDYLPEAHTDFIFAIYAEEMGLVGIVFLVALYLVTVAICLKIAFNAFEKGLDFGGYVASGIGLWVGLQAMINMGVNLGMLPTTGITLPLISYGGSSLLSMMICLGLLNRIVYETNSTEKLKEVAKKTKTSRQMEIKHV
jgi:cell division protein FtsW